MREAIAEPCAGAADQTCTGGYAADYVDKGAQARRIRSGEYADCVACEPVCSGDAIIVGEDRPGRRPVAYAPARTTSSTVIHPNRA
ncbi:hypothetical protein AWB96_17270 [Mycobacteroides chelonae]|nr:hypothetical protein AWB96_17270 [Mycobacteroides chelonae]